MEHRQEHKWDLGRSALFGSCASTVAAVQWQLSGSDFFRRATAAMFQPAIDLGVTVTGILSFSILHAAFTLSDLFVALDYFKEMIAPQEILIPQRQVDQQRRFDDQLLQTRLRMLSFFNKVGLHLAFLFCCYSTLEADAASKLWTLLWVDSLIDWIFWTYLYGRERDNESSFPICHIHIRLLSFPVFDGRCLGDEFSGVFVSREAPRRVPVSSGCCSDRFEGDFDVVH